MDVETSLKWALDMKAVFLNGRKAEKVIHPYAGKGNVLEPSCVSL
jgi:hypothetical protein